jgi:hypothetical protein
LVNVERLSDRPRASLSRSSAAVMLQAATELHTRWDAAGWDLTIEDVVTVRKTLDLLADLLEAKGMATYTGEMRHEAPVDYDAEEIICEAGKSVAAAARELERALGQVDSDPRLRAELVERGL